MGRIFITTAIPSILTLVVLTVMIAFQGYSVVAYPLGLIAFIWGIAFLLYLRQKLNITLRRCSVTYTKDWTTITLTGSIWSRHSAALYGLSLYIVSWGGQEAKERESEIPNSIDNTPKVF